jgi:hypothetical protein
MASLYERAERRQLAVGGERLDLSVVHVKNGGAGPRLLLLHGNPGTLDDFAELVAQLSLRQSSCCSICLASVRASQPRNRKHRASAGSRVSRFRSPNRSVGARSTWSDIATAAVSPRPWRGAQGSASRTSLKGVQKGVAEQAFYPEPLPEGRLEREVERILSAPTILSSMVNVAKGEPLRGAGARRRRMRLRVRAGRRCGPHVAHHPRRPHRSALAGAHRARLLKSTGRGPRFCSPLAPEHDAAAFAEHPSQAVLVVELELQRVGLFVHAIDR